MLCASRERASETWGYHYVQSATQAKAMVVGGLDGTPAYAAAEVAMAGGRELSSSDGPGGEVALVYLTLSIVIGAAVAHALSRYFPSVQYTPTLLIIGVLTSIAGQLASGVEGNYITHIHQSLRAWESMDGHLILYVFLPPLLFADSMNLQWSLIRRCLAQCALLAGPGVALGAVLNGLFARYVLPYGWSWEVCWSYGAVQAATDPVAVVSAAR